MPWYLFQGSPPGINCNCCSIVWHIAPCESTYLSRWLASSLLISALLDIVDITYDRSVNINDPDGSIPLLLSCRWEEMLFAAITNKHRYNYNCQAITYCLQPCFVDVVLEGALSRHRWQYNPIALKTSSKSTTSSVQCIRCQKAAYGRGFMVIRHRKHHCIIDRSYWCRQSRRWGTKRWVGTEHNW